MILHRHGRQQHQITNHWTAYTLTRPGEKPRFFFYWTVMPHNKVGKNAPNEIYTEALWGAIDEPDVLPNDPLYGAPL